jgi:hypothetical protein
MYMVTLIMMLQAHVSFWSTHVQPKDVLFATLGNTTLGVLFTKPHNEKPSNE